MHKLFHVMLMQSFSMPPVAVFRYNYVSNDINWCMYVNLTQTTAFDLVIFIKLFASKRLMFHNMLICCRCLATDYAHTHR